MITDEMLRTAAAKADQAILDALPDPKNCVHPFSAAFERKMKRLLRRGAHPVLYRSLRRAACFLAAVLLAGTSWLTVDVNAREALFSWVRRQYEQFVEYRFVGSRTDEAVDFVLNWLPDGYEESKEEFAGGFSMRIYQNAEGQQICLICSAGADATSLFVASEDAVAQEVRVGGQPADFYQDPDPQKANLLVWQSQTGEILFSLSAALPQEDLVRMAESVAPSGGGQIANSD